ncbi:MAG: DUF2993 domain-containing protein [Pseudanabaenaceae cyanobacterium SKYGB_i_bin29]|nr:DUF2993 domain-containing protein [Pseudanabaenaceae cyanobacterium SKYG29]MDW8422587.1 DUF2993 domain-containing protein [Pseudanabaenaceae cyanobacterium SKYGB_i_bin29]
METLAIILTSLLGLGGGFGILVNQAVEGAIRQQVPRIEELAVRVDSSPNYQILQGKIDRVRLASRGVYFFPFLRVDVLELETDRVNINLGNNQVKLLEPLRAVVKVVLREEDINRALEADQIRSLFQSIRADFSSFNPSLGVEEIDVTNPQIFFLSDRRIRLTASLSPRRKEIKPLDVTADLAIEVLPNGNIKLSRVDLYVEGMKIPDILINTLVRGVNRLLDLTQLEAQGIKARVLKFEISQGQIQFIGFTQLDRLP